MRQLAPRLTRLERSMAQRDAQGPSSTKPWPPPEWWREFEQCFAEMMTETNYLRWVSPGDESSTFLPDDERSTR